MCILETSIHVAGNMYTQKRLTDAYRFLGFIPSQTVKGIFGDPKAKVIHLHRRQKNVLSVDEFTAVSTIKSRDILAISRAVSGGCIWSWMFDLSHAGAVVL